MNIGVLSFVHLYSMIKRCYVMKKVEKKSGKQRLKNAELGTENRKTHDVEPKTENTGPETTNLIGPIFFFSSI